MLHVNVMGVVALLDAQEIDWVVPILRVSVPLLHNILQVVDVIHEDRYSVVVFEAFDVLEGCGIVDARVIVSVFEFLQHADAVVVLLLGGLVVLHTPSKAL